MSERIQDYQRAVVQHQKRSYRALVVAPILALANACPITEHSNAWSWAAEGDDLFWMWWWLGYFTIVAGLIVWVSMDPRSRKGPS